MGEELSEYLLHQLLTVELTDLQYDVIQFMVYSLDSKGYMEDVYKRQAQGKGDVFVAADMVGAGVGEDVLVVTGSTARRAAGKEGVPVDSAIVGIIDSMEIMKENKNRK